MSPVFLSDSVWLTFGTTSVSTGAATNADSTPAVTILEDGVAMGYAPTVTNITTGLYQVQIDATAANGFEAGRRYAVYAVATVGGVTGRDGIGEFEVLAVDLNTGVASVTGSVGSVTGLTAANLDVAVSSRMATYAQPTGFLAATFPAALASTTNITAGTITTATNVTTVNGLAAGVITAASIAADAITDAKVAADVTIASVTGAVGSVTGAVGSVTGAVGSVTGNVGGNVVGSVATATNLTNLPTIPANWITTAGITDGALTAAKFAVASLNGKGDWNIGKTGYSLTVAPLDAAATRAAVGLASANLDTQLDTLPTAAEIVAAQLTTAITEAYRANGAAPTLAQFMSEVLSHLGEAAVSGTTKTIKKFDHATTAATFSLDSASDPTTIQRAS